MVGFAMVILLRAQPLGRINPVVSAFNALTGAVNRFTRPECIKSARGACKPDFVQTDAVSYAILGNHSSREPVTRPI